MKNEIFYEKVESPYFLRKRMNVLKHSKKFKLKYISMMY